MWLQAFASRVLLVSTDTPSAEFYARTYSSIDESEFVKFDLLVDVQS